MKILVTGGAGFIGSHLVREYHALGHEVTVLDSLIPQVHGTNPQGTDSFRELREHAEVLIGDVTVPADLDRALAGQEIVVHLAAETGTGQSMYEMSRYVRTNVDGTALLLERIAGNPNNTVRRVLVSSSRAIYGEGRYVTSEGAFVYPPSRAESDLAAGLFEPRLPSGEVLTATTTDEASALHPVSVYGITKLAQESLVLTAAPAFGVESVALRYQNVYGPGQSLSNPYTGILSIFTGNLLGGREINVFEDGLESRDFVFVSDVVRATVEASLSERAAGLAINVGSGVATTVLDVVANLSRALGVEASARVSGDFRVGDIRHNVAELALAREVLSFEPQVSLAEGLDRFVAWVGTQERPGSDYEQSLGELRARGLLK